MSRTIESVYEELGRCGGISIVPKTSGKNLLCCLLQKMPVGYSISYLKNQDGVAVEICIYKHGSQIISLDEIDDVKCHDLILAPLSDEELYAMRNLKFGNYSMNEFKGKICQMVAEIIDFNAKESYVLRIHAIETKYVVVFEKD